MTKWLDDLIDVESDVKSYFAEKGETPSPQKVGMFVKTGVIYHILLEIQKIHVQIKRQADGVEEQNKMIRKIHKLDKENT